jgi:hypothetical protein
VDRRSRKKRKRDLSKRQNRDDERSGDADQGDVGESPVAKFRVTPRAVGLSLLGVLILVLLVQLGRFLYGEYQRTSHRPVKLDSMDVGWLLSAMWLTLSIVAACVVYFYYREEHAQMHRLSLFR